MDLEKTCELKSSMRSSGVSFIITYDPTSSKSRNSLGKKNGFNSWLIMWLGTNSPLAMQIIQSQKQINIHSLFWDLGLSLKKNGCGSGWGGGPKAGTGLGSSSKTLVLRKIDKQTNIGSIDWGIFPWLQ